MSNFELKKTTNNKYYLNIFQGNDDIMISNGFTFEKTELYELYIKLREVFTNNQVQE